MANHRYDFRGTKSGIMYPAEGPRCEIRAAPGAYEFFGENRVSSFAFDDIGPLDAPTFVLRRELEGLEAPGRDLA
jgi:hypothetical protein